MSGDWAGQQAGLAETARKQLFFVGGAPRSGTTWLTRLLDSHPAVSCRGEGFFGQHLAAPLDNLMQQRRAAIATKNTTILREVGGYALPAEQDTNTLLGTAILLALRQQSAGKECAAVGEKTPENVFFFPRLKRLFPQAKFIGIARDPRDVLASSWHFFKPKIDAPSEHDAKMRFIRSAMESIQNGLVRLSALPAEYPGDCLVLTYEALVQEPERYAARMFGFLGVEDGPRIVADCVASNRFPSATAGAGSFFRRGVAGGWQDTFTPEMNHAILERTAHLFPTFDWRA
jgi:hypothetical protein